MMTATLIWKLALGSMLLGAMLRGLRGPAPTMAIPRRELGRVVLGALLLYCVGAFAWYDGHATVAVIVYASGITICTLAAWLSRGIDPDDPPQDGSGDDGPPADQPPIDPGPRDFPLVDWDAFERERARWGQRTPSGAHEPRLTRDHPSATPRVRRQANSQGSRRSQLPTIRQ